MDRTRVIVNLILKQTTSEEILDFLEAGHALLVETSQNDLAVTEILTTEKYKNLPGQLTTFSCCLDNQMKTLNVSLELLEDHFSEYSEMGEWSELRILGEIAIEIVISMFASDKGTEVRKTPYGVFVAKK